MGFLLFVFHLFALFRVVGFLNSRISVLDFIFKKQIVDKHQACLNFTLDCLNSLRNLILVKPVRVRISSFMVNSG